MDLQIAVVIVGSENERDFRNVLLKPGTRCSDILRDLGLSDHAIRKPDDSGEFFAANDDVYAAVDKAGVSKLEAVPGMPVATSAADPSGSAAPGRGFLSLFGFRKRVGERIVIEPDVTVIAPVGALPVVRRAVPIWRERGWRQIDDRTWRGRYRVAGGSWDGEVLQEMPTVFRPWIFRPPLEVAAHPHRLCLVGSNGRHWLHFEKDPTSVDAAILAMENHLAESFRYNRGCAA